MTTPLVVLHLIASAVALVSGGLVLSGRGHGALPKHLVPLYLGSVGAAGASSLGLFRETGGWHALHGVALLLLAVLIPPGLALVRQDGAAAVFPRHRRTLSGTYLVLLVSTVLETARRIVAPMLAARGFEAWEAYWVAVGLLAAGMAVLGLRLIR